MKMRKKRRSMMIWGIMAGFLAGAMVLPGLIGAGNLDPPAGPDDSGRAMYTLEDIYNRLNDNTIATPRTGALIEPSADPGSTGRTLDEVYEKALPTQVRKTGQTKWYTPSDDGALEKGVPWPIPRFTDNTDGTVTDNLTGLIWLKNANCAGGKVDWNTALDYAGALYDGCPNCFGGSTDCGLSDGSDAGDWRLPNVNELKSLIDFGNHHPALPSGYPFSGVHDQTLFCWSGTTFRHNTTYAWSVGMHNGWATFYEKQTSLLYLWPVRGGND
ncbi:MAG: DUF1566 domain-containing protein [Deltaproteobacteria bacterium]|nr:DUF1566 domain-containing protein [Deltaproteobacteria bacterium]